MEQKVLELLQEIDEGILSFEGENLFEAGLLDSFLVIDLVGELEDTFDIELEEENALRVFTIAEALALLETLQQ